MQVGEQWVLEPVVGAVLALLMAGLSQSTLFVGNHADCSTRAQGRPVEVCKLASGCSITRSPGIADTAMDCHVQSKATAGTDLQQPYAVQLS